MTNEQKQATQTAERPVIVKIIRKFTSVSPLCDIALRKNKELDELRNRLKNERPSSRKDSAYAFGKTDNPLVIIPLYELLYDAHYEVRMAAASSLGMLGPRARIAGEKLLNMFKDSHEQMSVRGIAASALGSIRYIRAMHTMMHLLKNNEEEGIHSPVIWALGKIGDRRALPALEYTQKRLENGDYGAMDRIIGKNIAGAVKEINARGIY